MYSTRCRGRVEYPDEYFTRCAGRDPLVGWPHHLTWETRNGSRERGPLHHRPTRSDDTILDGVFVPNRYVARIVPAGALDPFVGAVFAWALLNFGGIHCAIAERARDLGITAARKKTSIGLSRPMAYHPEIQHLFSEMQLTIEAMGPQLEKVAEEWSNRVDHGAAWRAGRL